MPISIPQKDCLQMAVSHELYEDLDSLTRNQELYLKSMNGPKPMIPSLEKRN